MLLLPEYLNGGSCKTFLDILAGMPGGHAVGNIWVLLQEPLTSGKIQDNVHMYMV